MRRYEVVFVLAPGLSEDEIEQLIELYTKVAKEKGASILNVDRWGKRRLAYPIKKHTEAHYIILTLEEAAGEAVAELERRFRVTDAVIRFLTTRVDEELKREEKFKKKKEIRHKRQARKRAQETKEAIAERE